MTTLELTEKMALEYSIYNVDYVYRIEHVFDLISHSLTVANRDLEFLSFSKSVNKREAFLAKLFGKDASFYGYQRSDFYVQEDKLLDLHIRMIVDHRRRLNDLFSVLDEDNMREVYRLGMFMMEKHFQNSVYMTGSRKLLECGGASYAYMTLMFPLDEVGFEDFFDRELSQMKKKDNKKYFKNRRVEK